MTGALLIFVIVLILLILSISMMFYFVFKINEVFDSLGKIQENNDQFAEQIIHNLEYHAEEINNFHQYFGDELTEEVVNSVIKESEKDFYLLVEEAIKLLRKKDEQWFNKYFPNGMPDLPTIMEVMDRYNGISLLESSEMMEE